MMKLSVNLNKIALVRNSRDGNNPDLLVAAKVAIAAGCHGITIHPREDRRHALLEDVVALAKLPEIKAGNSELNVEGDLRADLLATVKETQPHQFTVVPVTPGEKTSTRGWRAHDDQAALHNVKKFLGPKTRMSVFVDATYQSVDLAIAAGAEAVEFYTGDYAKHYGNDKCGAILSHLVACAEHARSQGVRVHMGHDLDLTNLPFLLKHFHPDEMSIGHAIASDAFFRGLGVVVKDYVALLR